MSGIYIPGMEMPTNCCQCPVNMEICKHGYKYLLEHPELYDKRADDCPLVPVPPHGRLIDADEFFASLSMDDKTTIVEAMHINELLVAAPTIIPADHIGDANEMVADKEEEG